MDRNDELQRLDAQWSAGQLSEQEYQHRRGQLLGYGDPPEPDYGYAPQPPPNAATPDPAQYGSPAGNDETQVMPRIDHGQPPPAPPPADDARTMYQPEPGQPPPGHPTAPDVQPSPPAPPPAAGAYDPGSAPPWAAADASSPQPPAPGPPGGDETQIVQRPAPDSAPVEQPRDDAETQVMHGPPAPDPSAPTGQAPDPAPPWASSEVPPLQQPDPGWMQQDAGSFASEPRRSNVGRILGVVVAVVVILGAGAGVGSYLLIGGDGGTNQPPARAQAQPPQQQANPGHAGQPAPPPARDQAPAPGPEPAAPPPANLPDPAAIGGDAEVSVISTFAELQGTGVLPSEAYSIYKSAGIAQSKLLQTTFPSGPKATILITKMASPQAAQQARQQLAKLQLRQFGFNEDDDPPPGLRTLYVFNHPQLPPTARGFYTSGDLLIRIEVVGSDSRPVARRYDASVDQQLAILPADT